MTGQNPPPSPLRDRVTVILFGLIALLLLIIVAFVAGIAFTTARDRLARDVNTTPIVPEPVIAAPSSTPSFTPLALPTATPLPSATPTPLPPTPTPERVCPTPVDAAFDFLYEASQLGCASGQTDTVWAAWEPFERGFMIWRSDTDAAYAFYNGDNQWIEVEDRWDGKPLTSRGDPPAGRQAPIRGFGYVWGLRDDVFDRLGWATGEEKGFCAAVQPFEQGFILLSSAVEFCTPDNLFNHARTPGWQPITLVAAASGWSASRPAAGQNGSVVITPPPGPVAGSPAAPTVPASGITRPPDQGLFAAPRAGAIRLDGSFGEWPDRWLPISSLAFGAADYSGADDLNGRFQLAWSDEGLYLALEAGDDHYRSGPEGAMMWQGDSIEIHFDRLLAADYANQGVNADDYQLGLSFGPGLDELRGYRWYPYDREGPWEFEGAVQGRSQGYAVEALLPWVALEVRPADLLPGATFGFNVSLSDNDGDEPAQQTILSASPARTTFDDPTEWGTLVLQ